MHDDIFHDDGRGRDIFFLEVPLLFVFSKIREKCGDRMGGALGGRGGLSMTCSAISVRFIIRPSRVSVHGLKDEEGGDHVTIIWLWVMPQEM